MILPVCAWVTPLHHQAKDYRCFEPKSSVLSLHVYLCLFIYSHSPSHTLSALHGHTVHIALCGTSYRQNIYITVVVAAAIAVTVMPSLSRAREKGGPQGVLKGFSSLTPKAKRSLTPKAKRSLLGVKNSVPCMGKGHA